MADTDTLLPKPTEQESGYESIDKEPKDDRSTSTINQSEPQQQTALVVHLYKPYLMCTVVFTVVLALLLPATIGFTIYFHNKDAACYSAIPQVGVYTRSDAYSILYPISDLSCSDKPIGVEVLLDNEAASVEIDQIPCQSIEKGHFQESYDSSAIKVSVNQPAPVFSEDFSAQNYFLNGSIRVDMVGITTTVTSVGVELCLFMNNGEFEAFLVAGANWKYFIGNNDCHSVQVKTGDSNSTIFRINEPTFAFVGIATTGNISIGNLTVTTNGVEVSGTGENATKICQLNGKHPTCNFTVVKNEREDFCLVAHEEERSDGSYDYSKLTIKFTTKTNVPFKVFSYLLVPHIIVFLTMPLCLVLIRHLYKRWEKDRSIMPPPPAQETRDGSTLDTVHVTVSISARSIQSPDQQPCMVPAPADQPIKRDNETSPDPEELTRTPIPETEEPTLTPAGPSVPTHGTVGTQSSAEVKRTIHVPAENDDQSATTTPNGNATELSTQESQRQSINLDQDPLSSEIRSSPAFLEPISEKEQGNDHDH